MRFPFAVALSHAPRPQMNMLGLAHLAAAFGEHERNFLEFRVDALFVFEVDDMAFDDVAVAADDFDELPGHGYSSFFATTYDGI
jgi:hypothetical protein